MAVSPRARRHRLVVVAVRDEAVQHGGGPARELARGGGR